MVRGSPRRESSGEAAQGGRRRGPGGGRGRRSWSGRWGASPVHEVPLVDVGMCCEDDPEVREVQGSLRRENCGGASTHRRRLRSKSRRGAWRNLGDEISRSITGPWRSCGAASGGPGCGGAAGPRRRRGAVLGECWRSLSIHFIPCLTLIMA